MTDPRTKAAAAQGIKYSYVFEGVGVGEGTEASRRASEGMDLLGGTG